MAVPLCNTEVHKVMSIRIVRAAVCLVLLVALVLAGCGTGGSTTTPGGSASKPFELIFWLQADDDEAIDRVMDELVSEFEAQHPDIKVVRTEYQTEELRSNFQTAALGGEGPHVVFGPNDNIGVFATMGIITQLDEVFPADFWDSFTPEALDTVRLDGKIWGVPDRLGNQLMLLYNKDYVKQAPETWDQLITLAKEIQSQHSGVYGLAYNLNEPYWFIPFYGGYGGQVMDENRRPTLDNDPMRQALQFVADLKFKHGIVPKECDYACADSLFKQGKAAFLINGPWSFQGYVDALGDKLGAALLPKLPGGDFMRPYTATKTYHITKRATEDPKALEAAKAFITFMTSKDAQIRLARVHRQAPTNKEAAQDSSLQQDPLYVASITQVEKGTPMPIVPEMRAIWDAIRPQLELVMAGNTSPDQAARAIQEEAVRKIAEMK